MQAPKITKYRGWTIQRNEHTLLPWYTMRCHDGSGRIEVASMVFEAMLLIDRIEGQRYAPPRERNYCRHAERCDGSSCREEIACND